jgi:hypothetical protein
MANMCRKNAEKIGSQKVVIGKYPNNRLRLDCTPVVQKNYRKRPADGDAYFIKKSLAGSAGGGGRIFLTAP